MREFPSRKSGVLTVGFQTERRIRGPGWSVFPIAPSTLLEPPRGSVMQPRRGRVAASPGACAHPGTLAAVDPGGGSRQGEATPQTGARAWRSLLALSPACGHHPRASGLRHTRAPRTAALGILGLHDASLVGLSDGSPPSALGPVLDFLRISVSSAVHLRLAKRSGREHGVIAPAYSRNHGAGAAAPYQPRSAAGFPSEEAGVPAPPRLFCRSALIGDICDLPSGHLRNL